MKNKIIPLILGLLVLPLVLLGTGYSWVFSENSPINNTAEVNVPTWNFEDTDFAKIDNVNGLSYLTATKEETITRGSNEAIRFTNTGGTSTRDHVFYINLDREYNLYDIATCKIEFDYYHAYKREQNTKGFPKLQLFSNNTGRGTAQGGDETITNIAPYTVTNIDADWWHLEYYITSMCPTMADHQDTPQSNYKVNRIKFIDRGVYDYTGTTAFMVLDNLVFTNEPGVRLGLFNRWAGDSVGKFFWFKVAWSGELHSCVLETSDHTIAIPYTTSTKSPFYVKLLAAGQVTITATLEIGSNHEVFSISNTITVTN